MFKNLTIAQRLTAGFALLVLLNAVAALMSFTTLHKIKGNVSDIAKDALPGIELINSLHKDTLVYRILTNRHVLSDDAAERKEIDAECNKIAQSILEKIKRYQPYVSGDDELALVKLLEPSLNRFRDVAKQIRALSSEGRDAEALALLKSDGAKSYAAFENAVTACVEFNSSTAQTRATEIDGNASKSLRVIVGLSVGSVIAAVIAGVITTRTVNSRLRRVADGLSEGAAQVAAASGQVSAASQSLAEGASEQAASLEETSASLEELSSMTKRNADNAQQAKEVSTQTRASADAGTAQMQEMDRAMSAIKASSSDIAKIIGTIDEIAFQTNILALNAAVEAARAGEAGAGFAVVADEVRALAQRAADAAKETAGKIEDAIQKSERGVTLSGNVAQALGDIVDKARKVDAFVVEIATASTEQNQGIGQINSAVGQMDKVTQSNAGNAEETAAAAEELNAQAQTMHHNVIELLALVGGAKAKQAKAAQIGEPAVRPTLKSPRAAKPVRARTERKPALVAAAPEDDLFRDM